MNSRIGVLVGVMAVVLAGCDARAGSAIWGFGDQTIHGSAVLVPAGTSTPLVDNSAISVCGACPFRGGGMTCFCTGITDAPVASDGWYTLHQEQSGPNTFSASADSTLEGMVSFTVDGSGDVDAPAVTLTPLGTITGTVTGLPTLAGVVVAVDGSEQVATTNAAGAFTLTDVSSGPRTLTAFQPGSPDIAAHAAAAVPYAAAATVVLDFTGM